MDVTFPSGLGMSKDRSFSTAIHIMTVLAYGHPNEISSKTISIGVRTNPSVVRRYLLRLSDKGLVFSTRGKGGGNRLAKPAGRITLKEIYLAVKDGPLFDSFDKEPFAGCPVSCSIGCILTDVYCDLEDNLMKDLEKIKLEQILRAVE